MCRIIRFKTRCGHDLAKGVVCTKSDYHKTRKPASVSVCPDLATHHFLVRGVCRTCHEQNHADRSSIYIDKPGRMMVDNPEISDDEIMSSLRAVGPPSRERWSDERIAYLELERLLIRTHPALISSEVSDAEAARIQDEAHAKRIQIFEDFGKATNTLMQTAWEDTVRCDEAHGWRGSDLEQRIAIIISDLNDKLLEARKSCLVQSCSVLPRQKFGRMRLTREATVSFVRSHPCDLEGQYTTSDEAETRDQIDIHRLHDSVGEDDGETSEAADDWIYIDDELLGDTESLDGVLVGADDHTYPDKGYDDSSEIMEDPDEIL